MTSYTYVGKYLKFNQYFIQLLNLARARTYVACTRLACTKISESLFLTHFILFTGFHHPITSSNAAAGLVTLTPVNFALPNSSHFNSMSPLDIQPFQHQPSLMTVTNPQSIYKLMA